MSDFVVLLLKERDARFKKALESIGAEVLFAPTAYEEPIEFDDEERSQVVFKAQTATELDNATTTSKEPTSKEPTTKEPETDAKTTTESTAETSSSSTNGEEFEVAIVSSARAVRALPRGIARVYAVGPRTAAAVQVCD